MTLEMIQQRVQKSESKRRRGLVGSIVVTLEVLAISCFGILWTHSVGLRGVFALSIAWALAGQGLLHRGMWSAAGLRGGEPLGTGLEYYRREIDRHLSLFRRLLQWSFGPVVLSIVALIAAVLGIARIPGRNALISVMPFTTLFVVWVVAFFALRLREQKKLQREIDDLNDAERTSKR